MALCLVALFGVAMQLPWIAEPFGFLENNAGFFFGPFAQSYERFGFFELRGIPLGPYEVWPESPRGGYSYFNHPPGTAWVHAALGTREWQLRLPSVLATIASGVLLAMLVRRRVAAVPAAAAGMALQAFPVLAFGSQVSYEPLVLVCGLALWLAFLRAQDGERGAKAWLALAAVLGPWADWSFGFFVLGLVAFAEAGSVRQVVQRLAMPFFLAGASLLGVLAWVAWAKTAPFVAPAGGQSETAAAMFLRAIGTWPAWDVLQGAVWTNLADGLTEAGCLATLLGVALLSRSDRRLAFAALVPATSNVVLFANHATTHLMFWCFFVVPAGLGVAALVHACRNIAWLRWAVLVSLLAQPIAVAVRFKQSATAPVFRELGEALARAAEEPRMDGAEPTMVATNAFRSYPYYVASQKVYLGPVTSPELLENGRRGGGRVQFVYVAAELEAADGRVAPLASPELLTWLQGFPKRELPQLRGRWPFGKDGFATVRDAWVFEL